MFLFRSLCPLVQMELASELAFPLGYVFRAEIFCCFEVCRRRRLAMNFAVQERAHRK